MSDSKENLSNDGDYSDNDSYSDNYENNFDRNEIIKSRIYDSLYIGSILKSKNFKHNTNKKLNLYYSEIGGYIDELLEHNELIINLTSSKNRSAIYKIPIEGLRYIDLQPFIGSFCRSEFFTLQSLNIEINNDQNVINVIILLE